MLAFAHPPPLATQWQVELHDTHVRLRSHLHQVQLCAARTANGGRAQGGKGPAKVAQVPRKSGFFAPAML